MDNQDPTPNDTKSEGSAEPKETLFSQEQVNDIISKRLAEANSKAEKRLKDEVSKAIAETERQSKLSEAEREKEFKLKQQQELDDRERTITLRERRADAKDALIERNIDPNLVEFVIDIDQDKTEANIDKLEKAFSKAVEAGVKAKLVGTSPEDYNDGANKPKPTSTKTYVAGLRSF